MIDEGPTRTRLPRIPLAAWVAVSTMLHALFVLALFARPRSDRDFAVREPSAWFESVPPAPASPPPAPAPPAEAEPPPAPKRASAPRKSAPQSAPSAVQPETNPNSGEVAELTSDKGTFAVGGDGTSGSGTESASSSGGPSEGDGIGAGEPTIPEKERTQGAAQLSMWLAPTALARMALVRPTLSLLMSVPGYRDALRGSGIRPFEDLERLRIQLGGLAAAQLVVAGVHVRGEQALLDTATQVAAMRNREPVWRGDSDLRATSWVDGSGIDRGLAVHEGAFVIAARDELPELLGGPKAAGKQVAGMSQMRERGVMLLTLEDAARYVPGLRACEAQALRLSVAASGGGYRMALTVHYKAASFAGRAQACVRALAEGEAAVPQLMDWIAQARSAQGSFSTSLQVEVDSDDVQQLLGELAWLLRRA